MRLGSALIRRCHDGHGWLGVIAAALLYLICLSGTATVFYRNFERWETARQPDVATLAPGAPDAAVTFARARFPAPATLYVYLPSREWPRFTIESGGATMGFDAGGHPTGNAATPATEALMQLHYELNIPGSAGLLLVMLAGVVLMALTGGGLLSRRHLFRDAFRFRIGQNRLTMADLHNRIGVWSALFVLAVAITGAMIAGYSVTIAAGAWGFNHNDRAATSALLFPGAPQAPPVNPAAEAKMLSAGLATLHQTHPHAIPDFAALSGTGMVSVTARLPGRLIYGEEYSFDTNGHPIAQAHYADGPAGRQIFASLYQIHYGNFGGTLSQWLYLLLGTALCVLCASGVDLWLLGQAKHGYPKPILRAAWTGVVWGSPAAMALATAASLAHPVSWPLCFWGLLALILAGSFWIARWLRPLAGLSLILLVLLHLAHSGTAAFSPAAWPVNLGFAAAALPILWPPRFPRRPKTA